MDLGEEDNHDSEDDFVSTSSESFYSTLSSASNSTDFSDIAQETDVLTASCVQSHGCYYHPQRLGGPFSVPLVAAIDMLKENARHAQRSILSPMQQSPSWIYQLPYAPYYGHHSYDPWQHVHYPPDHSAHDANVSHPQSLHRQCDVDDNDDVRPRSRDCKKPLVEQIRGAPLPPLPAALQKEREDRQWRSIFTC